MPSIILSTTVALITIYAITCQTTDDIDYRLPRTFQVIKYKISLTVPHETLHNANENSFTGKVVIIFNVLNSTNVVKLHSGHTHLQIVSLTLGMELSSDEYDVDNTTDILTIRSPILLNEGGTYFLTIKYEGQLSSTDMLGFYKSNYKDNEGVTHYLATTQFEPVYAREAFPCFDEPAFKSIFEIDITVPQGFSAMSNSPHDGIIKNTTQTHQYSFVETKLMSTYLVAFIISDFTCTEGEKIGSAAYRVCSRDESNLTRRWALDIGPKLLANMNNYTDFHYDQSQNKLDQVAMPDFSAGAMENWGLVTYRELFLLWDPQESSNSIRQFVTTIISHEFAHFWFGNLVTLDWWSDVFLNEGLARYFEYHNAHEVIPDWQLDKQFVVDIVQSMLLSDSVQSTTALHTNVNSPSSIEDKFGMVSYHKGGSIFRMLEHIMGKDNFRSGLVNYIRLHAYKNTKPENLWEAMNSRINNDISNFPDKLDVVMHNWINNPGYPLVTVKLEKGVFRLTQERFLLSGSDNAARWYIPISYTLSTDQNKFVNTTPRIWLANDTLTIQNVNNNVSWIILNNQQTGYYRVNYDDSLWTSIGRALGSKNFGEIDEINRAQIIDDLFNLAKINRVPYWKVFEIIEFVNRDTSYFTWLPTFAGFQFLLHRVGMETVLGHHITRHISRLMTTLYQSTPFTKLNDDDQIYTLKQVQALTWACGLGHEDCIQSSRALFLDYRNNKTRPHRNLRSIVYCNAVRNSTDSTEWEFLWDNYMTTTIPSEKYILLSSLGCTRNKTLLELFLNKSITDNSGIRPHDRLSVFKSVLTGNIIGFEIAFDFLTNNQAAIAKSYQSMNSLTYIMNEVSSRITDQMHVDKLNMFLKDSQLSPEFKATANHSLEVVTSNLLWRQQFEQQLHRYYDHDKGAASKVEFYTCAMLLIGGVITFFNNL